MSDRRGFTLVEILVALVISGILATVIFQLLQGQSRFVATQSSREEVQQNARGGLDLITSEMRGVPPGAVVAGSNNMIEFLAPKAWGLLCSVSSPYTVLFPQLPATAVFTSEPASARLVFPTGTPGGWTARTVSGVPAAATTATACSALNPEGPVAMYTVSAGAAPASVQVGDRVFLARQTVYDAAVESGGTVAWLRRNNGTNQEAILGPLASATTGLVFTFRDANGAVLSSVNSTNNTNIRSVEVQLTTQSRSKAGGAYQLEEAKQTVNLRNTN